MMINSNRLRIWTIICHFFIVIGFGHGVLTLGILEILWLPFFRKEGFTVAINSPFTVRLSAVVISTFIGQCLLVASIISIAGKIKVLTHVFGLLFLWLSIAYYTYDLKNEHNVHFGTITCIPLFICTLITFFGRLLQKLYYWVLNL